MLLYYSNLQHNNWLYWSSAYNRTRQPYISHIADAAAALLKIVSPENAVEIWQALLSSKGSRQYAVERANDYIVKESSSLSYRRGLLRCGKLGNKAADTVNCLTWYCYSDANLHQLQYGRGTQMPLGEEKGAKIRIDRKKLEYFLAFITSLHIVQDLPFGETSPLCLLRKHDSRS